MPPIHPVATSSIHPVAAIALSESIPEKDLKVLRDGIEEGANVGFQLTAKCEGRLTRGVATEALPTASLLSEAIFAETIRRLGVTARAWEIKLFEVAMEALVHGAPIKDKLIAEHPELLQVMYLVKQDVISKLPKQPRRGAIKVIASLDFTRLKVA